MGRRDLGALDPLASSRGSDNTDKSSLFVFSRTCKLRTDGFFIRTETAENGHERGNRSVWDLRSGYSLKSVQQSRWSVNLIWRKYWGGRTQDWHWMRWPLYILQGWEPDNYHLEATVFIRKRLGSPGPTAEMPVIRYDAIYTILRGRWCDTIVLNVHAVAEDRSADTENGF